MTLAHWTDTDLDRMLAKADAIAKRQMAEADARRDAILRRYEPRPIRDPRIWEIALRELAKLAWAAWAVAVVGLIAKGAGL